MRCRETPGRAGEESLLLLELRFETGDEPQFRNIRDLEAQHVQPLKPLLLVLSKSRDGLANLLQLGECLFDLIAKSLIPAKGVQKLEVVHRLEQLLLVVLPMNIDEGLTDLGEESEGRQSPVDEDLVRTGG